MAIITRLETISPRKAQKMLDERASNRRIGERYAGQLAEAMTGGEFEVNGETIKVDDKGRVIDGQHRLYAIVLSGLPLETFVTRGLSAKTFDTIDTGRRRTVGDVLTKHGELNSSTLAGALSWLWKYRRGYLANGHGASPRHTEAMATLEADPGIRDSVPIGRSVRVVCSPSLATCMHYLFSENDSNKANEFFELLGTGENIAKGSKKTSAVYCLRERLLANRVSTKEKLPNLEICRLVIKAWNAFRAEKLVKALRHRSQGDKSEAFPEIQ